MFIRELLELLAKNAKEMAREGKREDQAKAATSYRLRPNLLHKGVGQSGPLGFVFHSLKMTPAKYDRRYQDKFQHRASMNPQDSSSAFKPEARFKPDAAMKRPRLN